MSKERAEEFKAQGNAAFSAQKFQEAVALYEKAIEEDPSSCVYYNNLAAAYHELKDYTKAIAQAKKSLELEDNAKGHVRVGAALWAQRKILEAKREYELAAALDSANQSVRENIEKLSSILSQQTRIDPAAFARSMQGNSNGGIPVPTPLGGEYAAAPTGVLGAASDVAVLVLGAVYVICSFVQPARVATVWLYLLLATIAQQALVMQHKGILTFSTDSLKTWAEHFSSSLLVLCVFAIVTSVSPQLFIAVFIIFYALIDLTHHKADLASRAGAVYNLVAPYIEKAEANRTQMLLLAASFESLITFTIMFSGGTMFTLAYIQYAKTRYNKDSFVQLAFSGMRQNVTRLTTHSMAPAFVDRYAQKFFDMLYVVSQQAV